MTIDQKVSDATSWHLQKRGEAAVQALRKRQIGAVYARSRSEALSELLSMIPDGATVVRGDSVTLEQIGAVEELERRSGENRLVFVNPLKRDENGRFVADEQARFDQQRQAFLADVFLTGVNAITMDGKLVSVDAYGNRVAPMIFGPRKVIAVAGANKIVANLAEALERIHSVSAPMNVRRHYLEHGWEELHGLPCLKRGLCAQCRDPWRLCLITVVMEGVLPWSVGRIDVVVVGEDLGL